jgi:prepilin-type N-terminal cleavage/methylation domain-containing protein
MRKHAFTLIELLVVIAIIAILAAILFPVFAQAKEAAKKTQTLTQFKQMGTATHIYLSDYDDVMPLGMAYDTVGNRWRLGTYAAVPNGWTNTANRHVDPRKSEEGAFVLNAVQPYAKNYQIYAGAGLPYFNPGFTPVQAGYQAPGINLTYNGILQAWSATAIAEPSKLPLMLENYKQNTAGGQISNPVLCCSSLGPTCSFNSGGAPQSGWTGCTPYGGAPYGYVWYLSTAPTNFTVWVYGNAMPFIASDTSAKMVKFNAPKWPQYAQNVNSSPWSSFDPAGPPGSPYWMTDCVEPGGNKNTVSASKPFYPGYFRPDALYDYTLQQCDFGGG